MIITEAKLSRDFFISLNQEELNLIEVVISNTAGVQGLANRMSDQLRPFRTRRNLYTVVIGGHKYTLSYNPLLLTRADLKEDY